MASKAVRPDIRTIGVSQADGAALHESLRAGHIVEVTESPSLADALTGGISTDNRHTVAMCSQWLDETRTVDEDQIANAMRHALRSERLVLEGGGAVGLGLLLANPKEDWGETIAVVCTGDNVDIDRLLTLAGSLES